MMVERLGTPTVSILMTCYNRAKYIGVAIESVIASSFKDWELIIVDDRSTDNTYTIATEYASKDNRIAVYRNEKNLGDYHNRNKAASYARGKYLKYLDSDDLIYPYSLEIMIDHIKKYPQVGLVFCDHLNQDNSGPFPILYNTYQAYYQHFLKAYLFYAGPGGTLIRTDVFRELGGFSGKRYLGDTEMWMKISLHYDILKVQTSLIWWRVHEGQEDNLETKNPIVISDRYNLSIDYIERSPLTILEKKTANINADKLLARKILYFLFVKFDFKSAMIVKRGANFSTVSLLKGFDISNKISRLLKIKK